jgi:hypothetical protein
MRYEQHDGDEMGCLCVKARIAVCANPSLVSPSQTHEIETGDARSIQPINRADLLFVPWWCAACEDDSNGTLVLIMPCHAMPVTHVPCETLACLAGAL